MSNSDVSATASAPDNLLDFFSDVSATASAPDNTEKTLAEVFVHAPVMETLGIHTVEQAEKVGDLLDFFSFLAAVESVDTAVVKVGSGLILAGSFIGLKESREAFLEFAGKVWDASNTLVDASTDRNSTI